MKTILRRLTSILITIYLVLGIPVNIDVLTVSAGTPVTSACSPITSAQESTFISVINNFGEDPETERNFTWSTSLSIKTEEINNGKPYLN